ncbi:MAG: DUF3990 domain-containing protein [Lachnospiraceae bacterium]|nr:DUF3990 domain-containing protein [Lachnospiraceae bacterium]
MGELFIFHGSENIVEKPIFGKGRKDNDYGQGFYCTENINMAREWAVDENRDGYVNKYSLDTSSLKILNLNSDEHCVLHWITILLQNRRFELDTPLSREAYRYLNENFSLNLKDVDVIKGFRADDSYFSYADDFVNGIISISQLSSAMHLGELGEQIFIRSKKAFDKLRFIGSEPVQSFEWYERKSDRDRRAREAYRSLNRNDYIHGELYMVRIIDEEVKAGDPRLQ